MHVKMLIVISRRNKFVQMGISVRFNERPKIRFAFTLIFIFFFYTLEMSNAKRTISTIFIRYISIIISTPKPNICQVYLLIEKNRTGNANTRA